MRIAITGASGNVGTALLRRLARGDHQVVALARRVPEVGRTGPPGGVASISWVGVDLSSDACRATLARTFDGADAVVHLAWGFQPSHDPAYLEELGVGGTRRVIAAVAGAGVPHLVHMSSVGAYSPRRDDAPVDETWPTGGVPTSPYSRHKAAAERLLDSFEGEGTATVVARMRPGIIGQRSAGSALLRYGVPALVPSWLLGHVPVLPLDRRLSVPVVHADDVADAIARALERRAGGAFNLAAPPPITTRRIADALGARAVHVPARALRPVAAAAWHARLQQVDPGWLDLAFAVPLLDTRRADHELGWSPSVDAEDVLREVLDGMRRHDAGTTPVLRPRTVVSALGDLVRRGPVGRRRRA
jgi:nucleoside-diphosphate-sugar epimerase